MNKDLVEKVTDFLEQKYGGEIYEDYNSETAEELISLITEELIKDDATRCAEYLKAQAGEIKRTEKKEEGGEEQEITEILEKSFGSPDEYEMFTEEVAEEIYLKVMKPRIDYLTEALNLLKN